MIEVLKQALEALETAWYHVGTFAPTDEAIDLIDKTRNDLRQAILELEKQEPVAWMDAQQPWDLYKNKPQVDAIPLYTSPQTK
jgi:hypothetical protein